MSELHSHYGMLLGIQTPWQVKDVLLEPEAKRVSIEVVFDGKRGCCSQCGKECTLHDSREERSWRHLDTMQFETLIRCRVPRSDCPDHGVKTLQTPWAGKHSRFTLLFEAFAVEVMKACATVESARKLLRLSWRQVQNIRERAVERGLARRDESRMPEVGIDEKSFGKGHNYISLLNDLKEHRVWDVVEGRTEESATLLLDTLSEEQQASVQAVALDMWPAFMKACRRRIPMALRVHDRFHVSKHLGDAIDEVRRQENKRLCEQGDHSLKRTRWLWLKRSRSDAEEAAFNALEKDHLEVARAWQIRELFDHFWSFRDAEAAENFFKGWYEQAIASKLKPVIRVARMLRKHLEGLLGYCFKPITNAVSEGFNSKIQNIKSSARGFRSFEKYRIAILFYCGKLDLNPQ